MPSRNVVKVDVAESYYHVYARGASKQTIFHEPDDFQYFMGLFARYLSVERRVSSRKQIYPNFHGSLELLAYCLMPNHFHLFIYQHGAGTMSSLMRSIMTSYSSYHNFKYGRTGPLFESRYKAILVSNGKHLAHLSFYIHLNPQEWEHYTYSSLKYYLRDEVTEEWLKPSIALGGFSSIVEYKAYLHSLAAIKSTQKRLV